MRRSNHYFFPRLDVLADRALPSVSVVADGGVVTVRGDQRANDIRITDTGSATAGNVTVVADGQTYTFDAAITEIQVIGRSGGDTVAYDLTGDLAGTRVVTADLGNGNDTFTATLDGNLLAGGSLSLEAFGKNGKDNLSVDAGGDVADGATLDVTLDGGNGKDAITVDYAGILTGSATFTAAGGNGKDEVTGTLDLDPTSAGDLTARWLGGNAPDTLTLTVTGADALATLDATIDGGHGKDKITASDNVTVLDGSHGHH